MKMNGWAPSGTQQDPKKKITARLLKDTRMLILEIRHEESDGSTMISIAVGPANSEK